MSRAPFVMAKNETAYGRDVRVFDSTIGARFPNPRVLKEYGGDTMAETADNVAREHQISRADSDKFAAAGNASGINDGAGALIVGNRAVGEKAGRAPRMKIISAAVAGVPPRVMGLGPVPASQKALERAGLTLKDMDVIEINEAFASQVLGCLKMMSLDAADDRINPNGGAIAIGHPLGASGARLALTAMRELERRQGKYALVSMCIGVGQGIAAILERVA